MHGFQRASFAVHARDNFLNPGSDLLTLGQYLGPGIVVFMMCVFRFRFCWWAMRSPNMMFLFKKLVIAIQGNPFDPNDFLKSAGPLWPNRLRDIPDEG